MLGGQFTPAFLLNMPLRLEGFFHNDNLLSIPLFLFMGMLLERTQIAEDMLHALDALFGGIRGGMAYTVVLVGASIAAITGFVSASVIAIGLIALPAMLRKGYDPRLATGVIAASGTLAQILPPSIVLIVLAEQLEVSLIDICSVEHCRRAPYWLAVSPLHLSGDALEAGVRPGRHRRQRPAPR